ncbi:hypothetical protein HK105_206195 [Polyrhizophydium stewartii]|uniref:Uncharacterized protein n=1 Tax=Polyrhizophydium stewartii TaxID=2732419 RepID=A0ABR4N441_9FUNG
MSALRSIFKIGERAIRTREYQNRLFWQQDSPTPTHVRKPGDAIHFGAALVLTGTCVAFSVQAITGFIVRAAA